MPLAGTEVTGTVAQKMYAAQAAAGENAGADADAGQAEPTPDDVVDAEFEEVDDSKKQ